MPTGPSRDESVQFSLAELLTLEDERLAEQERATLAREAERARELEEQERRRRVEGENAARLEAEAREDRRRRELEDVARREAMQKAIVEQSRLEVEIRARADERERERRHEIELERLRGENRKGPSLSLGGLVGAAAMGGGIMLAVMLGIQLGITKPATDRRIAELQQGVAAAEGRADDAGRQLNDQRRVLGERDRQLADARTEIDALKAKKASPRVDIAPISRKPNPPPGPKTSAQPDCDPHDPMCFSLKTGR